jgi:hypothetical protein
MAKGARKCGSDIPSTLPPKPKREVQVVTCPGAFPISTKPLASRKRPRDDDAKSSSRDGGEISNKYTTANNNSRSNNNKQSSNDKSNPKLLDWHETAKEIRAYGATAFVGQQKRNFEDEQYFQLTGRHKKKQKVPLPIVRGIKKAAAKRDAKAREEARQAGIVLPKEAARNDSKKASRDSVYRSHGPAPNIGFMKGGVFRVSDKKGKR